ncbi:hypothetical protein KY348_02300 [Candidatus Woesearchaeota archaeon]|nr:hypothetical protein [Candidatus Woesearchaeota archaeon]
MDPWIIVGAFGVIFTSLQLIPQVIKSLKTKKVRDISIGLSIIVGLSAISWLAYAIHLKDLPLAIANIINLIGASILFTLKIREKPGK